MAEPQHAEYMTRITNRVVRDLTQLYARTSPVRDGLRVPDSGTMPIGTGKRMKATILFLDICGFSDLPSEEPDEQGSILQSISLLFSEFIRIIEDFGGTVEKNTGDGLMAYFSGSPDFNWQHEVRALVASLYMLKASEQDIQPIFELSQVPPLPIRITLNTGNITIAEVGAKGRFRGIVAVGTAANVASKMLKVAKKGDLLVGWNVVPNLPPELARHLNLHSYSDQFTFRSSGLPYPYFTFSGRY